MSEMDAQRAWSYALWLLGRRSYTEAELRRKLDRKGASQATADEVLERLSSYRLVDDAGFAEAFVRSRSDSKGPLALRQELRRKGVGEELVEASLGELDETAQLEAAAALLRKHAWRFAGEDHRRNRAKAFAFLARRGFLGDTVLRALELAGPQAPEFE